jgi:DNA-binding transcriptional LysR family regulator
MSTNYLETISTLIAIGLGWSVLPLTLVNDLKIMPVDGVIMARELGYIHHRQRSLSNAAQAFLRMLNGVAQGITPD